jgi:hypothetical protein
MHADVLDPRNYSDDLRESAALRAPPEHSRQSRAA